MPGYLTNMAVLIEAEKWLGLVEDAINNKDVFKRSKLDDQIVNLAHKVRYDYLRFKFESFSEKSYPHELTSIKNKIGDGLAKLAFAGSLGPDFIAAGNVLALNQRWVSDTIHKGAPRRSWKNAHTTEFVLYNPPVLEMGYNPSAGNEVPKNYKKLHVMIKIGHVASVASHVVLEPFIQQWAWEHEAEPSTLTKVLPWPYGSDLNAGDPIKFAVQIDARMAQGYFQCENLHANSQSWADYLPKDDLAIEWVCKRYLESFSQTYGTGRPPYTVDPDKPAAAIYPRDAVCAFPTIEKLAKDLGQDDGKKLEDAVAKYPQLKTRLEHWTGLDAGILAYKDIFTDDDKDIDEKTRKEINDAVNAIGDLQRKLANYPCSTPKLDIDFLKDAYAKTRNWALDAGYDHAPWITSLIMSGVILLESANPLGIGGLDVSSEKSTIGHLIVDKFLGFGCAANIWSATVSFGDDPLDGKPNTKAVRDENRTAWIDKGITETIVFDMFDNAYGCQGIPLFVLGTVLTGIAIIHFDGLFGQGADALSGVVSFLNPINLFRYNYPRRKLFVAFNDFLSPLLLFPVILQLESVVKWYRTPAVRWIFYWVVNVGFDAFEALLVNRPDPETGLQGDPVALRIFYLRLWITASFVTSSLIAFGAKAGDPRTDPKDGLDPRDYLLGWIVPLVVIAAIVWGKSGFEGALLRGSIGIDWPSTDTDLINPLLGVVQKGDGKVLAEGTPQSVALFTTLTDADEIRPDGAALKNSYFPEAPQATGFADLPTADNKARKDAHTPSANQYQFKNLFDRAAMFAGLMSMALVNYESEDTTDKTLATQIFKDWNLDFRTEGEWNDLMEDRADKKPGLLKAAENWWNATRSGTDPAADDVEQLEIALGVRGGPSSSSITIEDRSVAPNNKKPDSAHVPLANLAYIIVDGSGATVASGNTGADGAIQQTLSVGTEYEIRIAGYEGIAA
jgi:hypothetical protein